MENNYAVAGKGLQFMFWGTIVGLVGAFIPLLGFLVMIVGGLVVLYGLYTAMGTQENYKMAMYMVILSVVLNILSGFCDEGIFNAVLSVASTVVSFLQVYYICTATAALLSAKGDQAQADKAKLIVTLNLICAVVSIVCLLVAWIPVVNVLAAVAAVLAGIVGIVAAVLQLIFYFKSSKSLLA